MKQTFSCHLLPSLMLLLHFSLRGKFKICYRQWDTFCISSLCLKHPILYGTQIPNPMMGYRPCSLSNIIVPSSSTSFLAIPWTPEPKGFCIGCSLTWTSSCNCSPIESITFSMQLALIIPFKTTTPLFPSSLNVPPWTLTSHVYLTDLFCLLSFLTLCTGI